MVDDKDKYEWVNVSSGTSSPRQSQSKGHKMVVVVVKVASQTVFLSVLQKEKGLRKM